MTDFNKKILKYLPYDSPFLFVDKIAEVSYNHIVGEYTFKTNEYFYAGHFKNNPVTPGVIILETMGQIGLVCFAIHLNNYNFSQQPLLSYLESEFYSVVKPGEKVIVKGEKIYFRNNTLKCKIIMQNEDNVQIATLNAILKLNQ